MVQFHIQPTAGTGKAKYKLPKAGEQRVNLPTLSNNGGGQSHSVLILLETWSVPILPEKSPNKQFLLTM